MRKLVASALATGALLVAGNASAAFHLMKIVEVNVGDDSYVELEMYSSGQTFLTGHTLTHFSSADVALQTINLKNVSNGDNHARVLIGTSTVEAKFGVKPDFTMQPLGTVGGKVCFDGSNIDCFSWGDYPNKAPSGAPFTFTAGKAAIRNVSGGATAELDGTEDTDSSAADFVAGTPAPRNNPKPAVDAGSSTSSSSSTGGTSSGASSGAAASSGAGSSSGAASSSGVTTNPSSSTGGTTSGASGAAPAATPSDGDDGGCNATGDTTAYAFAPMLGLLVAGALSRRRRR
ncbi:MAG: MYXO-CTERM sorting domain-containing protein [Labilithrix sp.]